MIGKEKNKKSSHKKTKIDKNNEEFRIVQELLEQSNQTIFLTGKAGTGKSTFLKYITENSKKKHVILAPTGIAAVNVGGQTLHSFFKIPLKPLLPTDPDLSVSRLRGRLKYSKQFIKLLRSLELIIIDEISMLRADVIDFIDKILRVYTGKMRLPFGGKQLLLVGDIFQLEPIVTGNDRDVLSHFYSAYYFFNAKVFKEISIVPIELTKVYRQEEKTFVDLLDNIRMGKPTKNDLLVLNSRYVSLEKGETDPKEFSMTIATRRDMVDSINDKFLTQLKTPSIIYNGVIENEFPLSALPTDLNLELKVGAQVVFVKNDYEKRWVNGTVAVVETCLPDSLTVRTEDGEVHEVTPEKWTNIKYVFNEKTHQVDEIELGYFMQYPLKLAWALTIHKSQGLTFKNVIIDIGNGAFTGGQVYVALSRCRSLDGITLVHPISQKDIFVKPEIVSFAEKFNDPKLSLDAYKSYKADMLFKKANEEFNFGKFADAIVTYTEALSLKPEIGELPNVLRLLKIKSLSLKRQNDIVVQLREKIRSDKLKFEQIAKGYVEAADELSGEGWEIEAAIAQYDKALAIMPDFVPAMLGKANLLVKISQLDEAFLLFSEVTQQDHPELWRGYIGMGDLLTAEGDDFNAVSSFMKAHEVAPKEELPLKRLIETYLKLNDFDTANYYKVKLNRLHKSS